MENRMILFGLHQIKGIGWKAIERCMKAASNLGELLTESVDRLKTYGLTEKQAQAIHNELSEKRINDQYKYYQKHQINVLTVLDTEYPPLLREIAQPPWVLYYKGNLSVLQVPLIAMVGTRQPTAYGKKMAMHLATELASYHFGVVSGLARGIDSIAHQGALQLEQGITIAVLGTGLDRIYPQEHVTLARKMIERGLVMTETPLNTPFHPGLFPIRNRIIAGLCLGTIVIEAAERSGSLITADQALEACRDVFALPGPVSSPKSFGCLKLIQQGAKCIMSAQDILEEYDHNFPELSNTNNKNEAMQYDGNVSEDEKLILALLSDQPLSFDEIFEKCSFEFGHLHSVLLNLHMKNKITQCSGLSYIKN